MVQTLWPFEQNAGLEQFRSEKHRWHALSPHRLEEQEKKEEVRSPSPPLAAHLALGAALPSSAWWQWLTVVFSLLPRTQHWWSEEPEGTLFHLPKTTFRIFFCECFMNEAETPLFRGREWTTLCGHQTDTHCSPVNPALHVLEASSHFYLEVPCLMLSAFQHKHVLSPCCPCVMSGFFLSPCDIYCWRSSEFPAPFMKDNAILSFCWSIPSLPNNTHGIF